MAASQGTSIGFALLCIALYAMILLSMHWGIVRYAVMIFPIAVGVSQLRRWPFVWLGFPCGSVLLEAYLLLPFVLLRPGA